MVDSFDQEKLTVVREHQRRRVLDRVTVRCRDCGTRTTGEAPPPPLERSKVTCEWLSWFVVQLKGKDRKDRTILAVLNVAWSLKQSSGLDRGARAALWAHRRVKALCPP